MSGRAFFDTNVLLYMYGSDGRKRDRAIELFREHAGTGALVLSTQVVQEFYVAGSKKLGMPAKVMDEAVGALLNLPLVIIEPPHIKAAIRNEGLYRISFWDGLILAAAESAGADLVFTEDLNDGQRFGTLTVRNPFA